MTSRYDDLGEALSLELAHVASRGGDLAANIQAWMATEPASTTITIAEDRRAWELRLQIREQPPLVKWGHTFGDAVSGLRGVLNHLVRGIVEVEAITLAKPLQLQFPIAATTSEWRNESKRVAELPKDARDAIEQIQPFRRSGPHGQPESDPLLLLRRLSNRKNHDFALLPVVEPRELTHEFAVEFASEAAASAEGEPEVAVAAAFEHGTVLIRQVTKSAIVKVRGEYRVSAQAVVEDPGTGGNLGATEGLAALLRYVSEVCEHVLRAVRLTSTQGSGI